MTQTVKKTILSADFMQDMIKTTANLYRLGWDERNGGNISYLLKEEEVAAFTDVNQTIKTIPLNFHIPELSYHYFLVTGSGKYFKNIVDAPEENLGIIRINEGGETAAIIWGFSHGTLPTSELPSHLMAHKERLARDASHRVVMHTHTTHLIGMTFTHTLIEKEFTRTLWKMCTECIVVFPEGVGIIPWMIPGTDEIGKATADKMSDVRLVVWPHHGVFGTGNTMDEAFGLIETAEKAAEIYSLVEGKIKQTITDLQLYDLAQAFNVKPREGYLNET
ncbi:rhamnulose-1-phosphate aldolase [Salipaludibacillus agaradhaerens]|uniref:rhamnulose-1-phosphate aldolase n=1 Tax=Salipaludibacillus agaradhaerens TaxID=76935 RepID=UPI0021507159|nr:rhamnulose-1-phosphate aldolase [Salipaludibacillus agaradhaerens]MCR6107730.1 rhamnulose-1-phosphate aldolase [Salipaludibacillus agaradhaerens]MCR6119759.1 rhamnulose-1-phosphate aldolase [Salipaludibacillus agaradhaerens]UJW58819.1 rhamnulose-1-phosphate aldolase [Bacillus sp. A116_S68]